MQTFLQTWTVLKLLKQNRRTWQIKKLTFKTSSLPKRSTIMQWLLELYCRVLQTSADLDGDLPCGARTEDCSLHGPRNPLRSTFVSTRFIKRYKKYESIWIPFPHISSTSTFGFTSVDPGVFNATSPKPGKQVPAWQAVGRKSPRSVWRPRFLRFALCLARVRSRSTAPMSALQALLSHTIKISDDLCIKEIIEAHWGSLRIIQVCCKLFTCFSAAEFTMPLFHTGSPWLCQCVMACRWDKS